MGSLESSSSQPFLGRNRWISSVAGVLLDARPRLRLPRVMSSWMVGAGSMSDAVLCRRGCELFVDSFG